MQFHRRDLGALALDRVKHRAPEHLGFHPTLDQVVLRAGGDRRDPEVLIGQPGEHDDRDVGVGIPDAFEGGDPARVGKVEIQQHAVGAGEQQFALGLRHRLCPCAGDVGGRIGDEFFDQQRVAAIVLYEQYRQPTPARRADRRRVRRRHGYAAQAARAWVITSFYVTPPGRATFCFSDNASDNTQGTPVLPHIGPPAPARAGTFPIVA